LALMLRLTVAVNAQTVDATQFQSGTVNLVKGWREKPGDDPARAQPGFDDSAWKTVDLNDVGAARTEWRWFRLHVKLGPGHTHEHLLIVGGDGVYAAYVNGEPVGDAQLKPWYAVKRPVELVVPLPNDASDVTLALRTHAPTAYTQWQLPLFLTAAVGSPDAIENERASFESGRLYAAVLSIAINVVLVLAGVGAFALYRGQRGHREYLWLGLYLLLLGISNGLLNCSTSGILPLAWNNLLADPLIYFITIVQIQFTFCFAGQRVGRVWRSYQVLLALSAMVNLLVDAGWLLSSTYVVFESVMILPAALLLPVLLLVWYRKGNREAGWLILPSLLPAATVALFNLGMASAFTGWGKLDFLENAINIGPVLLPISDLGDFLYLLAIGVVMFFRFTRVSREQARGAAELEAAREMQQRLVPAVLPEVAGYAIEAAFFPAAEVGGDFYQLLDQGNGARLVVVGDVSGKGLKAAMTGTLAMGALRTLANEGLGPATLLMRLNRQLVETAGGGFTTCVCVQIRSGGELLVANAGHLSPYRNGEELAVDAGLPLGIAAETAYTEQRFKMEAGDRLTLMSDGVVEARDATGALFGFERTRAISAQPAEAIAAAAREFGQEDDITVMRLTRN
jgi:hypothetical protein